MTKPPGMLIDDAEILARYPGDGDIIIDKLDHDPKTQKYEAMWHGKRNRAEVEKKLIEIARA